MAPGPASSGTASGTTPLFCALSSSFASCGLCRTPPGCAFSIASAIIMNTIPPPTWKAGRLAPMKPSKWSPKSAVPASTPNTVNIITRDRRRRWPSLRPAVTTKNTGTAKNGSSTASSVTKKRVYSVQG